MGKEKIDQQDVKLNTVDSSSKIDAIKQLIFGENMQAYDSEFETLKQDILNKKESDFKSVLKGAEKKENQPNQIGKFTK